MLIIRKDKNNLRDIIKKQIQKKPEKNNNDVLTVIFFFHISGILRFTWTSMGKTWRKRGFSIQGYNWTKLCDTTR